MSDKTLPGSYISVADFSQRFTRIDPNILQPGEAAPAPHNSPIKKLISVTARSGPGASPQTLYSATTGSADVYPRFVKVGGDSRMLVPVVGGLVADMTYVNGWAVATLASN